MIQPEKGDTDADLDKVLCPPIEDRKIGNRKDIDVTACLPKSTVKAMGLGPYNCSVFVRSSLGDFPASKSPDVDRMLTPKLWDELLKKAFTIRGLAVVKEDGTIERAQGTSWKQGDPRMGDIVFMRGDIRLKKGEKEPRPRATILPSAGTTSESSSFGVEAVSTITLPKTGMKTRLASITRDPEKKKAWLARM